MSAISGNCHCGAVTITLPSQPVEIFQCNCSLCTKSGWLGVYGDPDKITISGNGDDMTGYVQGDKTITLWHCRRCGCSTHWTPLTAPPDRMGVNIRLFDVAEWESIPRKLVDGASF